MDEEKPKVCPFRVTSGLGTYSCTKSCSLWMEGQNCCALYSMATSLANLSDFEEMKKHG